MSFSSISFTLAPNDEGRTYPKTIVVPAATLREMHKFSDMNGFEHFPTVEFIKAFRAKFNIGLAESKAIVDACKEMCHRAVDAGSPNVTTIVDYSYEE